MWVGGWDGGLECEVGVRGVVRRRGCWGGVVAQVSGPHPLRCHLLQRRMTVRRGSSDFSALTRPLCARSPDYAIIMDSVNILV